MEARRGLGLVVLTGGVFRRYDPAGGLAAVVATVRADPELAPALDEVSIVVDTEFTLTPAGLLAGGGRTVAAEALLRDHLLG